MAGQRAAIIAGNLVAPLGVLLLGWNVAAALFIVWLDTLFISLQLGILVLAAASHALAPPADTPHTAAWWVGVGIGVAFLAPMFVVPPLVVGGYAMDLVRPQFAEGPWAAVFSSRLILIGIGLTLILRGGQVLTRAAELRRDAGAVASFIPQAGYQFLALAYRMLILMALIWVSSFFGRHGAIVFLLAATALLTYGELHENWLHDLAAWAKRKEDRLRERRGT